MTLRLLEKHVKGFNCSEIVFSRILHVKNVSKCVLWVYATTFIFKPYTTKTDKGILNKCFLLEYVNKRRGGCLVYQLFAVLLCVMRSKSDAALDAFMKLLIPVTNKHGMARYGGKG